MKDPTGDLSIAKEIIDATTGVVYIAGASQTISEVAWPDYSPPEGMLKNTIRHLLFDDDCYVRSFSAPADCQGKSCVTARMIDGFSWMALARAAAFPNPVAVSRYAAKRGNLRVTQLVKCNLMEFRGEIYELSDPTGNRFVIHATGAPEPTMDAPPKRVTVEETAAAPARHRTANRYRLRIRAG